MDIYFQRRKRRKRERELTSVYGSQAKILSKRDKLMTIQEKEPVEGGGERESSEVRLKSDQNAISQVLGRRKINGWIFTSKREENRGEREFGIGPYLIVS